MAPLCRSRALQAARERPDLHPPLLSAPVCGGGVSPMSVCEADDVAQRAWSRLPPRVRPVRGTDQVAVEGWEIVIEVPRRASDARYPAVLDPVCENQDSWR